MTTKEIQAATDIEIKNLWNELAMLFETFKDQERPRVAVVGFFQLSRETERRGLKIDRNIIGEIILTPKTESNERQGGSMQSPSYGQNDKYKNGV